ncbi:hypothetical protein [Maribacter flavus]|uniref:Uncharacterized protein n=1 Tax=Maribacter flavus TaxID=1658664 RepID=A0A5B2TXJ0_9FLAO|nr:hypothetical protein [Maribacter flavus]KAA2218545.1 hypothetical protein F0361_02680 [Maribacter flavus]
MKVDLNEYPGTRKVTVKPLFTISGIHVFVKMKLGNKFLADVVIPVDVFNDKKMLSELVDEILKLKGHGPKEGLKRMYRWANQ